MRSLQEVVAKPVILVVKGLRDPGLDQTHQFDTAPEAVQYFVKSVAPQTGVEAYIDMAGTSFPLIFTTPDRFKGMSRDEAKALLATGAKQYSFKSIWEMWLANPKLVDPTKVKGIKFAEAVIAANS